MKLDIYGHISVPVSEDPGGGARKPPLAHGLKTFLDNSIMPGGTVKEKGT